VVKTFKRKIALLPRMGSAIAFVYGSYLSIYFEAVTVILRFGFSMKSEATTSGLAQFTFGYRIHHGYVGLLFLVLSLLVFNRTVRNLLIIFGVGLFLSDLIHHFLVLKLLTGSDEFTIRYPGF
jgi:hypothetical protein